MASPAEVPGGTRGKGVLFLSPALHLIFLSVRSAMCKTIAVTFSASRLDFEISS